MSLEGELTLRLSWDGHRVRRVTIDSSRPAGAARMLCGKPPGEVVATVPLLFSICGGAQGAAARTALGAAGAIGDGSDGGVAELGVMLEAVQEYFWRLLIDWPHAMGREPCATPVAAARHRIAAIARAPEGGAAWNDPVAMRELGISLSAIAAKSIFGTPPEQWLAQRDLDALQAWAAHDATLPAAMLRELLAELPELGRSDVALMPAQAPDALVAAIVPALTREPDFARAPTWNGAPMETGALARMQQQPVVAALAARIGNAVATRTVARLAELAVLLRDLAAPPPAGHTPGWVRGFPLASAEGLATVQTARGLLLHRARLAGGLVADYQIVAPTEWNFHPEGALARGLQGLVADDEIALEKRARLAVQALDPCVECRIEVGHA